MDPLVDIALGRHHGIDPVALYFSPRGRIGRATFWRHGLLALLLLDTVAIALLQIAGFDGDVAQWVALAALTWPSMVLCIKRWHDMDRSGWWTLLDMLPVVGVFVVVLVNGGVRGTRGGNRFGPDPLASGARSG